MCDDTLEILMRALDQRKQGTASCTCRLAPDGHIVGIATESCNILVNPLQGHQLIQKAQVLGVRIVLTVWQVRQVEEPEDIDSVIEGHDDDIRIFIQEIGEIVHRVGRSAYIESATVNPYDNRLLSSRLISFPDVQVQAVLACSIFSCGVANLLDRSFPIVISLIYPIARRNVHWSFPAQVADRLLTYKGNAFIGNNVLRLLADKGSVNTFDGQ